MSKELRELAERLQAIPSMAGPWRADTFMVRAYTPADHPRPPGMSGRTRDNITYSRGMLPPMRAHDAVLAASYVAAAHPGVVLGLIDAYDSAEKENDNLRTALAWLTGYAEKYMQANHAEQMMVYLGQRLDDPKAGAVKGADEQMHEDEEPLRKLLERAADHLNGAEEAAQGAWGKWRNEAARIIEALRSEAAQREAKKPILLTAREQAERAAKSSAHRGKV